MPDLSVSRDRVALGLAPWGYFEMASEATISVLVAGKRMGTVYLGCMPETNLMTLSAQLTNLLTQTLRRCGNPFPEIVYVTDAGDVETGYGKDTLLKFYVDGKRIKITRVIDYYHASKAGWQRVNQEPILTIYTQVAMSNYLLAQICDFRIPT